MITCKPIIDSQHEAASKLLTLDYCRQNDGPKQVLHSPPQQNSAAIGLKEWALCLLTGFFDVFVQLLVAAVQVLSDIHLPHEGQQQAE